MRNRKRSWAKLISKAWHDNPEICRSCGKTMEIVAAIAPRTEDVIERILRHLKLWAPPWKRQRNVRGPPPSSRAGSTAFPAQEEEIDYPDSVVDDALCTLRDQPGPPGRRRPADLSFLRPRACQAGGQHSRSSRPPATAALGSPCPDLLTSAMA